MKKTNIILLIILIQSVQEASAGSFSSNMTAAANVIQNCQVSASTINFGTYDGIVANATTPLNATGTVTIACTKGATGVSVGLSYGSHNKGAARYLDAAKTFAYNIYQPINNGLSCAYATPWGNTAGVNTLTLPTFTSKASKTYNVCAQIPTGQDVVAGNYSDSIVATVNF